MWSVYRRLAELWNKQSNVCELSDDEKEELKMCLDAHTNLARQIAEAENMSFVAHTVEDVEWQHEICATIENLHNKMIGAPYDEKKIRKSKKK